MEFLNEFKEKFAKTAKIAVKKSNELVEITKLSFNSSEIQGEINDIYKQIGRIIYESYCEGALFGDDITTKCEKITGKSKDLAEIKEKLSVLKNIKVCQNCKRDVPAASIYCPSCGGKIED
jgi:hypothetical protein